MAPGQISVLEPRLVDAQPWQLGARCWGDCGESKLPGLGEETGVQSRWHGRLLARMCVCQKPEHRDSCIGSAVSHPGTQGFGKAAGAEPLDWWQRGKQVAQVVPEELNQC